MRSSQAVTMEGPQTSGEPSFTEPCSNGEAAPKPAVRGAAPEPRCQTLKEHCGRIRDRRVADEVRADGWLTSTRRAPLCFFQVLGVEALGEPAVDGREQVAGVCAAALVAMKPGQVRGSAQFE